MLTQVQSSTLKFTVWKCACIAGCLNTSMTLTLRWLMSLLWPARATTKISLAAPRHHLGNVCRMGVPERGGGQKAADCLNYLATQPLPYKENTNTYYNLHFTTNMK